MSLTGIIGITLLLGLGLGGAGLVLFWRRPRARALALAMLGVAVLLQSWWVALLLLELYRTFFLRQST